MTKFGKEDWSEVKYTKNQDHLHRRRYAAAELAEGFPAQPQRDHPGGPREIELVFYEDVLKLKYAVGKLNLQNKQGSSRKRNNNNPKGRGGFRDHPDHINRKGRPPKDRAMTEKMMEYLEGEHTIEDKDGNKRTVNRLELLVAMIFQNAIKDSYSDRKLIWNYIDGLPRLNIDIEGSLVNLNYDVPLAPGEEKAYRKNLNAFFDQGKRKRGTRRTRKKKD